MKNSESLMNDPEFLLRCAATHDWDTLISFAAHLEEVFTLSVPDRVMGWQQSRIGAARRQLSAQDQWGNTALHVACYNSPPLPVVTSILSAASCAQSTPIQVLCRLSRDHSTPLLVACATGASLNVIEALVDPPAGLQNGGTMVTVADQQGCTPLSELVIQYELQRSLPRHSRNGIRLEQVNLISDNVGAFPLFDEFWSKVELLVRSAWLANSGALGIRKKSFTSILHGAAFISESCPPVLTKLICRCYPHLISYVSRDGLLPLHLAIISSKPRSQGDVHPYMVQRRAFFVEQLLSLYPAAARTKIPGSNRSLFCQAIVSGLHWSISNVNCLDAGKEKEKRSGPLELLWNAAPDVLATVDPVTGLYPCLLAASLARNPDDVLELDSIFSMLRSYPQIVQEALR